MANHSLPQITSLYTDVISDFNARINDLAVGFEPTIATSATNMPVGTIGWQSAAGASGAWYKWSGSSWQALATTYGISISGNAATASKLANSITINGISFDGSSSISINTNTNNSLLFSDSGNGASSGISFNGSVARTISYNSVGAPSITGTNATGTNWSISITGSAAKITTVNWTIEQSGTDILFKYGGIVKLKLTSAGTIVATDSITAYGTA